MSYDWNELYNDEEELLNALYNIDINEYDRLSRMYIVKEYSTIKRLRSYYLRNGELNAQQMNNLKRMSYQIKVYERNKKH